MSPDQETHARALGYRTAAEMNADHDRFHDLICRAIGIGPSPTLTRVAQDQTLDHDWVRYEEAMVLAAQQFMNAYRAWSKSLESLGPITPLPSIFRSQSSDVTDSGA